MSTTSRSTSIASPSRAFTIVELLVVVAVIALLIGILLPALHSVRQAARSVESLSNVRQIGSVGMQTFLVDNRGRYPWHSSILNSASAPYTDAKPRWADYLFTYVNSREVFLSPMIDLSEGAPGAILAKPFWHEVTDAKPMQIAEIALRNGGNASVTPRAFDPDALFLYGGYGYNYQYLGNGRLVAEAGLPFRLSTVGIQQPSNTIVVGDTEGANEGNDGQYVIDPPLPSERGSGRATGYYASTDNPSARAVPSERNRGKGAFVFADGSARELRRDEVDDSNGDGTPDNGYFNGRGDAYRRW